MDPDTKSAQQLVTYAIILKQISFYVSRHITALGVASTAVVTAGILLCFPR